MLIQRKGRGRPKKMEIGFEELQEPEKLTSNSLIYPVNHGMTFE
jgi:hypothetical protein